MDLKKAVSHITSDLAGVFCQLSLLVVISENTEFTEEKQTVIARSPFTFLVRARKADKTRTFSVFSVA